MLGDAALLTVHNLRHQVLLAQPVCDSQAWQRQLRRKGNAQRPFKIGWLIGGLGYDVNCIRVAKQTMFRPFECACCFRFEFILAVPGAFVEYQT